MRKLERKYARELVVIGVHSAKFPAEKDPDALRAAVLRHGVGHPVVNDREFRVWQEYAVRAWPTLMFVDPRGKVLGKHEGEFNVEVLDRLLGDMIGEYERDGSLDRRPLSFRAERENDPDRPLYFPGKVLADAAGGRLFVADTGHHRVLELGLAKGELLRVFGDGDEGLADGPAASARFRNPQGLARDGSSLYVADTENHALRRIDLTSGRVETLAGTGAQAQAVPAAGPARRVALNSPWDLAVHDSLLYVAMAGYHQIWVLDLAAGTIVPWAGSGRENIQDGPRAESMLAQPSGLALDARAGVLYVADSEVSAVRAIDIGPDGQVRTLVGAGLFEFGDRDGTGPEARLQHPLGLALGEDVLYVADSYNHKVKRLDPRTKAVTGFLGSGVPGRRDGTGWEAQFSEPGGLSVAGPRLYIADTNNHAVRVCTLATGEVSTMTVRF